MKDDTHNSDAPVTHGELKAEFEIFEGKMEQLLSDQANVILGAVDERMSTMLETIDERMDKKLNDKIDPVITKLDSILKGVEDLKDENAAGAAQLRRHEDRISALEVRLQRSS
jgi:hypothetical protein